MKLATLGMCCLPAIWMDFAFSLYFIVLSVSLFASWYTNSFLKTWWMDLTATTLTLLSLMVFMMCVISLFSGEIFTMKNLYQTKILMLMSISTILCFATTSLLSFYVFLETTFLLMFLFLTKTGTKMERKISAYYMFFFTIATSLPLLIFLILSSDNFKTNKFTMMMNWSNYWWFFIFLVFFVKMPMFGTHMWLPKAHVEAPLSGSIILSGILLKIGFYGVIRLSNYSKTMITQKMTYIVTFGWMTAIIVATICIKQLDIKSMVAYSSVVHMGMTCSSMFSMTETSFKATLLLCYSHGLSSPMMFFGVYMMYQSLNSRSMMMSKGTSRSNSLLAMLLFFIMLASLGVPPLLPFFGEFMSNLGVLSMNQTLFPFTIILMFASGTYMIYFYVYFSHGTSITQNNKILLSTEFLLTFFLISSLVFSIYLPSVSY